MYNVLTKYGVTDLPYDIIEPVPNAWYSNLHAPAWKPDHDGGQRAGGSGLACHGLP